MELVLAAASRPEHSELVSEEAQWLTLSCHTERSVVQRATLRSYYRYPQARSNYLDLMRIL